MDAGVNEGKYRGLSGASLKVVAMITMLIDHLGACILYRYLVADGKWIEIETFADFDGCGIGMVAYFFIRLIGRLAFPIYVFLLIEGFTYTRSRLKYLMRLTVFAFVSEIPFDMCFECKIDDIRHGHILEFSYQNVFFTLAIGFATIYLIDICREKLARFKGAFTLPKVILCVAIVYVGMAISILLRTDYSADGVLAITVMYAVHNHYSKETELTQENPHYGKQIAWVCLVLSVLNPGEISSFFDCIFAARYNGKKGGGRKYFFYAFYPVHLLILALICVAMGI